MSNKKNKIRCVKTERVGSRYISLFAIRKENYLGKIMRIEGVLGADTKLVAEIKAVIKKSKKMNLAEKERFYRMEEKRISKERGFDGPYRKVLSALPLSKIGM